MLKYIQTNSSTVSFPIALGTDNILFRVVSRCCHYLNRPHILKEEGLFRISGSAPDIQQLNVEFTLGK